MEGFAMSGQQESMARSNTFELGRLIPAATFLQQLYRSFSESQLISDTTLGLFIYVLML
jgi:hypothetical protein